jgi:hypothetical protein
MRTILALAAIGLLVSLISGCGGGGGSSSAPNGAKTGSFVADHCAGFGGCTEDSARAKLHGSDVWCRWDSDRVKVHVTLENQFNAHVSLRVTPKYEIKDGGDHGDSFGSDVAIGIPAQAKVAALIDAGTPEGVPQGTEISKCEPNLQNIDITGGDTVSGDSRVQVTPLNN